MSALVLEGLQKSFGGRVALAPFSLTLPEGEIACVMGPSGCGKTTLLRMVAGLLAPDGGRMAGVPVRVSVVFQEDRLVPSSSALGNLRLALGRACPEERMRAHLAALGLSGEDVEKPAGELSGGMARRVALARAVLHDGPLLLLDEAFKGLDEGTRAQALDYFLRERGGRTVLCVTHDEAVARALGGRLVRLG